MPRNTSWEPVSKWYADTVGESGHYYHQHVVLPNSLKLLALADVPHSAVLDLACGQGVLARALPPDVYYQGLDIAPKLIEYAKQHDRAPEHHFAAADITRTSLPIQKKDFTHATLILAIQNLEKPQQALQNAATHLRADGKLLIVMNHPCFRIPRQSSWGVDERLKTQYRRIDRYFTPLSIPITAHPGQKSSTVTWSFHQPLSAYFQMLQTAGFVVETVEEWSSNKTSVGKAAKMENRSRAEFPLFLTILAKKIR